MTRIRLPKITLWRALTGLIFAAGFYATYLRFVKGFEVATNLSNAPPSVPTLMRQFSRS